VIYPGSLHHVTARGAVCQTLFVDREDRVAFLGLLDDAVRRSDWTCHAYCLMGNHFHLVVQAGEHGLAPGMHRLNLRYARRFNQRYDRSGHAFDRRFADQLVTDEAHLLELVRYVHLNPVRAGLQTRPGGWEWSSYRAIAGLVPAPRFLSVDRTLELFGGPAEVAREHFVRFVDEGIGRPEPGGPTGEGRPDLAGLIRRRGFAGGAAG
jgi:REP element-mobilizing transposase RayT